MKLKDFVVISALILALGLTGCGGGSSAQVQPPPPPPPGTPSISSISPTSALAGSSDLLLTVTGNGFVGTIHNKRWPIWSANGTDTILATTFVSNTQLTAVVPAALLSSALTAQVSIQYGDPMGDGPFSKSNSLNFKVTQPVPNTVSVSPSSDTLGPRGLRQFAFTIDGGTADATWIVEEGAAGGSINSSGLYTAPQIPGTYHVVATAASDPSKTATAAVSVAASGFRVTGSMGRARSGHVATLLANGKVLIVGGDASAELFDPASKTFTPTGNMTTLRYGATATLVANGTVLIAGGFGSGTSELPRLSSAEFYDPGSGTFTATGSMAVGRVLHTATLLNDGRVLIAGGTDANGGGGAATASCRTI